MIRAWARVEEAWVPGLRRRRLTRLDPGPSRPADPSPSLIVSLTSHRARFPFLELALRSLLDQSTPADAVVLWVSAADRPHLPSGVEQLSRAGVEIREMPRDRGPASKLLPALAAYPGCRIVTADDDVVHSRTWLAALVAAHRAHPDAIACMRAHFLTFTPAGRLRPYLEWEGETHRTGPDSRLFFTGHGGVLYPPAALPPAVQDDETREALCPLADDVWFNWMARLAGTDIVRTPGRAPRRDAVPGSQSSTLLAANVDGGGNDEQISRLTERFGAPDPATGRLPAPRGHQPPHRGRDH